MTADPWSYQVDILVLSMDLTAGKTWDQKGCVERYTNAGLGSVMKKGTPG